MATRVSKKGANGHSSRSTPAHVKSDSALKRSIRVVKSPPKSGALSKSAVRSAVANVVLAHKK